MQVRRWMMGVGAGSLLLMGGLTAGPISTFAQSRTATPPTHQVASQSSNSGQESPSYTGSIRVAQDTAETSDAGEAATLQKLAKITVDQAKQAATKANPGTTAKSAEIGDENGYLVYDVSLSNGVDVTIDAGNGHVLATEKADAGEANDAAESTKGADHDSVQQQSGSATQSDVNTGTGQ